MAETSHTNFEDLLKGFAGEDGNIPGASIGAAASAVRNAIGNEFVDKGRYNAKLTEIRELKEEKQKAEDDAATAPNWQQRYEEEHSAFEAYKADITARETLATKQAAYREMLKDSGIAAEYQEKVLKYADLDAVELDAKGNIKGAAALVKAVREEWPMFLEQTTEGSNINTPNPPESTGGGTAMTRDQILDIKDTEARQAAIGEHIELFGGL